MPIVFHESTSIFHIYNNDISYIIKVLKNGQLGQLYYGRRLRDNSNFDHLLEILPRAQAVCIYEDDNAFSLEHIKQEYPSYGTGDMREPAIDILQKDGSRIVDFKYKEHKIFAGKSKLEGLPGCYVHEKSEATSLEIILHDSIINSDLILSYTIYNDLPVICRHSMLKHYGNDKIILKRIMSVNIDLPDKDYNMIELTGAWGRERSIKERPLEDGITSIYSLRGRSSGNFNPFIAFKRKNTDEYGGEVLGICLAYSGNFLAMADVDTYNITRVSMGIHPHSFEWELSTGDSFTTPEAIMVYSQSGINKISQVYHDLFRKYLIRGKYRDSVRPILLNNWEGTRFDFDENRILSIAKKAKEFGVELFVLDDGWFGNRNNDHQGLGDWYPNLEKLPSGISGLSRKINDIGLLFGLWIEPEMVNKDSYLYKEHPDWTLKTPKRGMGHGRNQYVVDFSNDEATSHIYRMLEKVLSESKISYIKWDMNRCFSEVYSLKLPASQQGKVMHSYVLGLYKLYEKLIKRFPNILFESCSAGGNRFDAGMLYYAPITWTSDNTDAVDRLKIQYGTSLVYPLASMGTHVSSVPNYLTSRSTSLDMRANVAYFGTFGYEFDATNLSKDEIQMMRAQVEFMKKNREIIQFGDFYRLKSPFKSNVVSWMVVSKDQSKAIVGYYRILEKVNSGYEKIKLIGLNPNYRYCISNHNHKYSCYGDELMYSGLITSDHSCGEDLTIDEEYGDYVSRLYIIEKE